MRILKNKIFIISAAAVIVVVLAAVLINPGKGQPEDEPAAPPESPSPDIAVSVPAVPGRVDATEPGHTEEPALVVEVGGGTEAPGDGHGEQPVITPEKPIGAQKPEQPADNVTGGGGVAIGSDPAHDTPYKCGAKKHKCENSETHAFITNLEIQGCSTCGSKSCASFYALDKWGKTNYDPAKCPKYDKKKDPALYCQGCNKKPGDGQNGTCLRLVLADNCPECGEAVPARTCHTCG
jgi:hypothetical protein